VVTAAAVLLLLAVPALAVYSLPLFLFGGRVLDVYVLAYTGTAAGATVDQWLASASRGFSVALLVVAAALPVATLGILFGRHPARLVAWLLGVLTVCGSCPVLLLEPSLPPGPLPRDDVERLLGEAMPGWAELTSLLGGYGSVAALLVAMVLLGTPRANDFFRRSPPAEAPPPPLHPH
jgi:hypothetical protein